MADLQNRGTTAYPPRVLQYRPHIKYTGKVILLFSILVLFGTFFTILQCVSNGNLDRKADLIFFLTIGLITSLALFLEYHYIFKSLAEQKIQAYSDKLVIKKRKRELTIPYSEIIKIKHKVNKNLGGWFTVVLQNTKKHRFTIAVERSEYILEKLYKYNPDLMAKNEYEELHKSLVQSDHGFARVYTVFKKKNILTLISIMVGLPVVFSLFALLIHQKNITTSPLKFLYQLIFLFTMINYLVAAVFCFILNIKVDRITYPRLEKGSKIRDLKAEKSTYANFMPYYLLTILAIFLLVTFTNIIQIFI